MKNSKNVSAALLLTLFLSPLSAHAKASFLEPVTLTEQVKKQIAKQSVKKNLELFQGEIFNGVSTAIQYRYKAEPSYMENFYTRYDTYDVQAGVNPAAWIEDLKAPFGLGFSAGSEILFARQFKTQKESITALPYTIPQLPVSSRRVIENLNPGDFVSFQTNLGLVASVGATVPAAQFFTASLSSNVYINGSFLVHVFKMAPKKVRVKLIALRGHGTGASANISSTVSNLKITGLNIVDKKIRGRVQFDPLALSIGDGNNDLFMVDYVFNLESPEAATAYDNLMQQKMHFAASQLLTPFEGREELEGQFVTDLTDIEEIFLADKDKNPDDQRIHRVFKGSTSTDSMSDNTRIGLNIVRFEKDSYYAQNKILSLDKSENKTHFLFDTFSQHSGKNYMFHLFDSHEYVNSNLLFEANDEYLPKKFVALVLSRERRSQSISRNELHDFQENLQKILPPQIYSKISWKNWAYEFAERVNVNIQHQISFNADSLAAIQGHSQEEIAARVKEVLARFGHNYNESQWKANPAGRGGPILNPKYIKDKADFIVDRLVKALEPSIDEDFAHKEARHQAFLELKDSELFVLAGAPILFSLLPQDHLEDYVNYQLVITGRKSDRINFKFPEEKKKNELYDALLYIQGVLNNRSIDLRSFKDEQDPAANQQKTL